MDPESRFNTNYSRGIRPCRRDNLCALPKWSRVVVRRLSSRCLGGVHLARAIPGPIHPPSSELQAERPLHGLTCISCVPNAAVPADEMITSHKGPVRRRSPATNVARRPSLSSEVVVLSYSNVAPSFAACNSTIDTGLRLRVSSLRSAR
jgi:hypothetical protein